MENMKPRVLIIEDQDVLRAMLSTILRYQPLDVDTAIDADEAMAKVESCDYALILIDLDLQNANAATFLARFGHARPESKTFIIAVRDVSRQVTLDGAVVSAVLSKPLEIDTLAEVVRECAVVVPRPDGPLPCLPPDSDARLANHRGPLLTN